MTQTDYDGSLLQVRVPSKGHGRPTERRELPPEQEHFRLYTEDELGAFPPVEWLIPGRLAAGEHTVLFGKGDTFKSFAALAWASELARLGHTVVYVVSEGTSGVRARAAAWRKYHASEPLADLLFLPSNVRLHDPTDVGRLVAALEAQLGDATPSLIVIDTLARNFVGGDENSPADMGLLVEGVERIRATFHTAVLTIHHTTKDGRAERGTESLRNATFAMYAFDRLGPRVRVTCDRMKEAAESHARLPPRQSGSHEEPQRRGRKRTTSPRGAPALLPRWEACQ